MKTIVLSKILIDGTDQGPVQNAAIFIEDDKIISIKKNDEIDSHISSDYRIVDARDKYVLPGLIDGHVHLHFSASENPLNEILTDKEDDLVIRSIRNAQKALSSGITTVRDCGCKGCSLLKVRNAINNSFLVGPRIVASGVPITTTGGHCNFFGSESDTVDDVLKASRLLIKSGVDFIKIMISGGNMTPGSGSHIDQYGFNEIKTIVDQAHMHGKKVGAHVHTTRSIEIAIEAGVDILEHASWMSPNGVDYRGDLVKRMVEKNVYLCPAMGTAYILPPEEAAPLPDKIKMWEDFQNSRFETTKKMINSGVKLVASTDAGTKLTDFDALPKLYQLMEQKLEMTPAQIIESTTRIAAEALGLEDEIGTVEKGKKADLIIVDKNPLEDISVLQDVQMVIKDGTIVQNNFIV